MSFHPSSVECILHCRQLLSRPRIPKLDQVVLRATAEQAHGRMPLDCFDIPAMSGQSSFFPHLVKVPYLDGGVVCPGDESGIVGCKGDIPNRLLVSLKSLKIVHVVLKILDSAAGIGADEPDTTVGPFTGSDGRVMGL